MMFKIRRDSGLSNTEVVLDVFADCKAGDVIDYQTLAEALGEGAEKEYDRGAVQDAVRRAQKRLSQDCKMALITVPNVGYRVAPAGQHMVLADHRKTKAERQMEAGLRLLSHVRLDEMDENQRLAHQGALMIMSAQHQQIQALERRQSRVEELIRNIITQRQ